MTHTTVSWCVWLRSKPLKPTTVRCSEKFSRATKASGTTKSTAMGTLMESNMADD